MLTGEPGSREGRGCAVRSGRSHSGRARRGGGPGGIGPTGKLGRGVEKPVGTRNGEGSHGWEGRGDRGELEAGVGRAEENQS